MKSRWIVRILLGLTLGGGMLAVGQSAGTIQAQSAVIRITSPEQHQRQATNFVVVRYELQNPTSAPAGSPNFQVQLDGNDPVTTATNEQTFTGLTPGRHVVTVRLVDANGTAIPNSQTQAEFLVLPTAQNRGTQGAPSQANQTSTTTPQAKLHPGYVDSETELPQAGSLLPILSVIGFGVLVGGIVSSLKAR